MGISTFKIFLIFGIVSAWAEKALKDNKVTFVEAADLATKVAEILGVNVELEIPPQVKETIIPSEELGISPAGDIGKPDFAEGKAASG